VREQAGELIGVGVRRIHSMSWRDLDDPDAGGSEVHHDEVFRRWAAAGLEIHHRSSTVGGPRTLERHGYHIVQRGSRYGVFPRTVAAEVLHRAGPRDAVVEIWNGVPWCSPLWHRGPRVTWLHHVHGPMWDQVLPKGLSRLGRLLETRLAPPLYRHTEVVTLTEASRDELVHLGFPPARVHVVPPGIAPRYCPGPEPRAEPPLLVAAGRLAPVKRFELVLDAVATARREVPELRLAIIGEGPERPRLERWIAEHGAGAWARLTGYVSDEEMVRLYRQATLIVSASLAEGWGMTLTEAGACGTPAVATDLVGHRGAVVDGVTGLLVARPGELGRAIAALVRDPARRERMGQAAVARARELTWDRTAADTLAVLLADARRRLAQPT
jgi:glycosyltransferase involved in cell wall biosynthesis